MAKLCLTAILDYDADMMHGDDLEATNWFFDILTWPEELTVWSKEIGDEVGVLSNVVVKEMS